MTARGKADGIASDAGIAPGTIIGEGFIHGRNLIVEDGVSIGCEVSVGHNVVIHTGTVLGDGVKVGDNTVLGRRPSAAATSTLEMAGELPGLEIGPGSIIGAAAVLYVGTTIGAESFIADGAQVRERCRIGRRVIIGHNVTVENDCQVGDFTKLQTNAYVTARTTIEENCFIAPCVVTSNDNYVGRTEERHGKIKGPHIKRGARIGAGAVLLPGVVVGQEALVAAGAVVTKDVPPYTVLMGIPARPVRKVPTEQATFPETGLPTKPAHLRAKMGNPPTKESDGQGDVPSFDLREQYSGLHEDLLPVLEEVMAGGHFILGEHVKQLEEEVAAYTGTVHGVGVANGSDALHLSLMACGIGPGDQVMVPAFTFFATAGAVVRAGARPVFVDVDPETFNIDVTKAKAAVTPRTKAVIPVHLYGQPAAMDELMALARERGLRVIEDSAQAIGASLSGRPVCSFGDLGCLSFFPTKNLGAFGDGGMVVTSDADLADKICMLRAHGSRPKYYHHLLGYNSRLDELQAAVLRVKLKRLAEWTKRRQDIAAEYGRLFAEAGLTGTVRLPVVAASCVHVYHQYTIRTSRRNELQKHLAVAGVDTAVYYPLPLHLQPVFKGLGYREGDLPVSERLCGEVLSLPMFPELTAEQQTYVVEQIAAFYGGAAAAHEAASTAHGSSTNEGSNR